VSAVLIPTATEAEWLERRREGVTASEIAVLMGLSPYSSPHALYHQKLGILPDGDDSDVMEKGRVLEPVIAEKFAALHPELMVAGTGRELFASEDRPWQLATPDRLLCEDMRLDFDGDRVIEEFEPVAVLECKVDGGSPDWGEPGTDEIPVHYRAQVLWQCRVMGVSRWHAACFNADRWKARWYSGVIDAAAEHDLKLMEDEAREFLDRIDRQDPPDVDWRPATIAALKTMHPGVEDTDVEVRRSLAIQYRAAVRRLKDAERRKDEMTARMLAAMGDARRAVSWRQYAGVGDPDDVIAVRSVSHPRRIDTEMLRTRHPAIAAECTKPPKPEVKLTPAKPKKDKP
jgi:putative phage-type endonuclease